jgi:Xaa-Pro aminopeptidase
VAVVRLNSMPARLQAMNSAAIEKMDHAVRILRLQAALADNRLDSLLVTHLANVHYLCGFTGSSAVLLVANRSCILFTDGRYREQAQAEVQGAKIVIARGSPLLAAAEWLGARRAGSRPGEGSSKRRKSGSLKSGSSASIAAGIEPESLTAGDWDRLAAALKGKARLRHGAPFVERARMVKDAAEIACIRRSVAIGAALFNVARERIRPGVTEVEVAGAMEYEARRAGAEGMSFPTIIASGTRSAIVHGRASIARVPARGFVVCDFGVILAGYCSDRTRTVHLGQPSEEARSLYASVLEAQEAAIAAVYPGAAAADIDAAARRVLRRRKLARYFTHSTGHGLGLEIHEAPRLAARQDQILEPGMVITIEPGVYVPGRWGVRIEDVVVVTNSGCEVLTPTDKELVII